MQGFRADRLHCCSGHCLVLPGVKQTFFLGVCKAVFNCLIPSLQAVLQVPGRSMAEKPNLQSLLRCRWAANVAYSADYVLRAAGGVAKALRYLHSQGIAHGDVYAHNVLADADGNVVLCDYGKCPPWSAALGDYACNTPPKPWTSWQSQIPWTLWWSHEPWLPAGQQADEY